MLRSTFIRLKYIYIDCIGFKNAILYFKNYPFKKKVHDTAKVKSKYLLM